MRRNIKRLRIEVTGIVQGVGFRPHVHRLAARWRLAGWARNSGGALELEVQGAPESCVSFLEDLVKQAPAPAHVQRLGVTEIRADGQEDAFTIIDSRMVSKQSRFVPVDIGICDACRRELLDAQDRRHHYPFTNCCACGPRYTIIERLPYDRERTSMRSFHLCLDCDFEYANDIDRRFHAEPNACPDCGPQYTFADEHKLLTGKAAVDAAAKTLVEGKVIGVKGIGGIHLTCLATDSEAVDKIRRLKDRPDKPLAVMVSDEKAAGRVGRLSESEADLLRGPERPIVLLGRRAGVLAGNICPGLDTVGVMLPYAPIHVLLLEETGAPLVMTSANRGGAPIIIDNEAAATQLSGVADGLLLHDRRIVNGCDDSVVRQAAGRSITVRLGRGKAPAALRLPGDYRPILACGSDLKSSVCLAAGGWAHVSQYLGDLSDPDCLGRFRETVDRLGRLLDFTPEVVACDAHPDYVSTAYGEALELPLRRVQHHHAHIAAVMAEKEISEPVIGVAFDGNGWGLDGNVWGGEWLICDRRLAVRGAHFKNFPMPGGEAAIRQPWRMAVGYLTAIGLDASRIADIFPDIDPADIGPVIRQIESGVNTPLTSSCGRLFEAVATLITGCRAQSYEGQAASSLESLVLAGYDAGAYSFNLADVAGVTQVDGAPMLRALLEDKAAGAPPELMATRFQAGLAESVRLVGRHLRDKEGIETVVLSGGVFVNSHLFSETARRLEDDGFSVVTSEHIPINDGGISLGQAAIVAAGGGFPD